MIALRLLILVDAVLRVSILVFSVSHLVLSVLIENMRRCRRLVDLV